MEMQIRTVIQIRNIEDGHISALGYYLDKMGIEYEVDDSWADSDMVYSDVTIFPSTSIEIDVVNAYLREWIK